MSLASSTIVVQVDHGIRRRGARHGQRGRRKSVRPRDREHDVDDADELPPGLPRVPRCSDLRHFCGEAVGRRRARARRGRPGRRAAGRPGRREQHGAGRGALDRELGADPHLESERPRALHLGDDEHSAGVQHRQIAGLSGCCGQSTHRPQRRLHESAQRRVAMRQLEHHQRHGVQPRCRIADQVAAPLQRLEHPEDLADRTTRLGSRSAPG